VLVLVIGFLLVLVIVLVLEEQQEQPPRGSKGAKRVGASSWGTAGRTGAIEYEYDDENE
jgi:hypothetical protein